MRRACLVLLGLLAGCQDGIEVDATAATFCDEYAEVVCHNLYECCTESQIQNELGVSEPRTELQCREDKTRSCKRGTAALRASLDAGRVTFKAAAYNACLSALLLPDDVCSTYVAELPWSEVCKERPWEGTVPLMGACFFDHDCAGYPKTAECAPDQKCVALPTAGFPCASGQCAADFFCGSGGLCQAKLAELAPCTGAGQCQENLFCDTTAMPMPICTKRQGGGNACTSNAGCISGDCIPGRCMATNQSCYTDAGCNDRCADDNSFCVVGSDHMCNTFGFCNGVTSVTCSGSTANQQCVNAEAGDRCVFQVACLAGDCIGDPVCTAPLFIADYCAVGRNLAP
jgi:hypothetical protein